MPRKIIIEGVCSSEILPDQGKINNHILDYLKIMYPEQLNFSIKESAKILNISEDFVRDRITRGSICANKFGRFYQINIIELTKLLEEGIE